MARIESTVLKNWLDGNVVTATEYKQEREILRVAINDNYDRLVQKYDKTEVDTLLASLQEEVDAVEGRATSLETRMNTAENGIANRYTKEETNMQIGILAGGSGFIDGGSFTDVYSSQFEMIDGGEF